MYKQINGKDMSVKDAATFIAKLNNDKKHHIGFCGTDVGEIVEAINEDLTDVIFDNCFVGAVEDGVLVGLIGMDIDLEDKSAEIWGPFVEGSYDVSLALELWKSLMEKIPVTIERAALFLNKDNKLARSFAEKLQFEQEKDQIILTFSRERLEYLPEGNSEELTQHDMDAFINLHDKAFPGTYYNGEEIMERINTTQKVFILKEEGNLAGYAYVEAEPDFGEAAIEFIAVDPAYQGRGYGKTLLATAIEWLFTFETIKEITLCVASDNKGAIGLYQSAGFQVEHELYYYSKKLNSI